MTHADRDSAVFREPGGIAIAKNLCASPSLRVVLERSLPGCGHRTHTAAFTILCLTLARWARLVPSLRGTWSGTLFSASSRDYGILSAADLRHRIISRPQGSGADFLNRTRSACCMRSHSRPLAKPRAQPFYFASGSASLRLSGFAAHRARVKRRRVSRRPPPHAIRQFRFRCGSAPSSDLDPRPLGEVGSESARNLEWDLIQRVFA